MKLSLFAVLCSAGFSAAATVRITRQGKFLYSTDTNTRFYIKGVAYQVPGIAAPLTAEQAANGGFPEPASYRDPLVDSAACARDIPNLVSLGVNTIRVYNVDPYGNHAACMNALETAGIYVIADLGLPLNGSINRATPSWDVSLLNEYLVTLQNLAAYPNLLAVNVGNEVVTSTANSDAAAFVKAAARDVKAYLRSRNLPVMVGYASADGETWRSELASYLTCGSEALSIDLYGLNIYQWCGTPTYATSGNAAVTTAYANFPVAAYFSEFGCITAPRDWSEVAALFSAPMTGVWSGGIAFEYFADTLGYGLTANVTSTTPGAPITTNAQFTLLGAQYRAAIPPATMNATAVASVYAACVPPGANLIASSTLPPTPSFQYCDCLTRSALGCRTIVNNSTTIGALLDTACALYSTVGGSCIALAGNGTTGVYGAASGCAPADKLAYVASQYYAQQAFNAQACSFGGNLTVNQVAPKTLSGFTAAVAACEATGPRGTFVPRIPSSVAATSNGSAPGSTGTTGSTGSTATTAPRSGASRIAAGGLCAGVVALSLLL